MNQLQVFMHPMFGELPVIVVDSVEWFGATESAKALTFSNPHAAIQNHVDEDDLTVHEVIDSMGRPQQKKFTNESGLYSLILGAARQGNNPEIKAKAKEYKRWVTSEVLPSIRKTGSYTADKPMTTAEMIAAMANQAVDQERRLASLESGLNQAAKALETVKETFTQRDENWRAQLNGMLNGAAYRSGTGYRDLRNESYRLLEERGHCDLNTRLRNLKNRLQESGATKTQIEGANKMDVIESEPRLKEIYSTIVRELSLGTLAVR